MIDFNKLTEQTRNTVLAAQEVMLRYKNPQILPEHLFIAMLEDENGFTVSVLENITPLYFLWRKLLLKADYC